MSTSQTARGDRPPEESVWQDAYVILFLRRRRLVIAVFLAVAATVALRSFLARPVYQATAQILIERESPSVLTFKEVTGADSARDDYYQTQYSLLQSRTLARKLIEALELLQDPEFGGPRPRDEIEAAQKAPPGESPVVEGSIDALLVRLKVQPRRNSRLVAVSVESFSPTLAAEAANKLCQLYIEQALEFRYQTSAEAGHWLGDQIEEERRKVEEAEISLQRFAEKEGIIHIEERRVFLEQKLREVGSALIRLKTQRLEKEALLREMRAARNPEELPEVAHNPVVQALRIELAALERQGAQLRERYLEQHPEVIKVRNQIEETRRKIAAEAQSVIRTAENDYKAVAAEEAGMATALESAKAEAQDLSVRGRKYDTLKREVDAAKEVLNSLLSRLKQTDVVQELKTSNVRIIDPATVPRSPVRPNRPRDLGLGVLLGLSLAVGLAFYLEYLDNTLKTPDDVRKHLSVPVLAVIPETAPPTSLVLLSATSQSPFTEGYRVLSTSLSYSWPDHGPRAVVVTSSTADEGKTLTSVNLALTLAARGDVKVLLVDGDLRRPAAHAMLRMKRTPGLSDLLVGQCKPTEAIQQVPGSRVSFLAAGTDSPSPADLMANRSLRGLLDAFRGVFDWIVLDAPPVAGMADAVLLAQATDGVAIVARAELVPRQVVRETIEIVAESGARVLGVVLNRAQFGRHPYYARYYYDGSDQNRERPLPPSSDSRHAAR